MFCVVQKLKEEGRVWCIHNASEKDDVLFPRDPKPLVSLSQDLVDFWHSTKVNLSNLLLALPLISLVQMTKLTDPVK